METIVLHHGEQLNPRFLGVAMDCSTTAAQVHLDAAETDLRAIAGENFASLLRQFTRVYAALTPAREDALRMASLHASRVRRRRLGSGLARRIAYLLLLALLGLGVWHWRGQFIQWFGELRRLMHGDASQRTMSIILLWLMYALLLAVCGAALVIVLWNLPGLWAMLLAVAIYAVLTHFAFVGLKSLIVLTALALIAEVVEFFASTAGAKRGAGRGGLWGAVIGGIVGGICFTGLIPIPIIGTIIGILLGTFLGAVLGELMAGSEVGPSLSVGVGAAKGRVIGTTAKVTIGVIMVLVVFWTALPIHARVKGVPVVAPPQKVLPATVPSSR